MTQGFPVGTSSFGQKPDSLLETNDMLWPQGNGELATGMGMPSTTQRDLVGSRADSVAQNYGQITPPDPESSKAEKGTQMQENDAAKRKERARNAANKRHAKTKKVTNDDQSSIQDGEATEDRGERQANYREKNRVAAAKCRAKKKSHNDSLEEIHRDEANKNKILKAELMGLRNELAQLRTLTLEHGPDTCRCRGIHEYCSRQADLIARGAVPQYGPSVHSPSQESGSVATPASEASDGLGFSMRAPTISPTMQGLGQVPSSFAPNSWMHQL